MNAAYDAAASPGTTHGVFQTTQWSVVLAAADRHSPQAADALEALCRAYWSPLYAFIRRQGRSPEDAQDLTQSFFARLLEKEYLAVVDPAKGRFRSFLLAAIKHFLADERDRATAKKRGGGQTFLSWDARTAEEQYRLEAAHEDSPERLFERRWALSLLAAVFTRLEQHYATAGKRELFQVLQRFLAPGLDEADYPAAARTLGLNLGAVRMAVHRLRRRYAELFREEVAKTVTNPADVEDEMRHLCRILTR